MTTAVAKLELKGKIMTTRAWNRLNAAKKLIDKVEGEHLLEVMFNNPGYVPTIRDRKVARAIKTLGYKAWRSETGKNW